MAKDREGKAETESEDVEPRSLTSLFRRRRERVIDGKVIELSGKAHIDQWRDWWRHPGRLPTHGYNPVTGTIYAITYPAEKCPHCERPFTDSALLARHVERDHGGVLHRLAKAVRGGKP